MQPFLKVDKPAYWKKLFPPTGGKPPCGFIIRRIREINGITQGAMAAQAEANISYISTVESGINNFSIRKLLLICNALGLQPAMLMGIWQNIASSITLGVVSVP